MNIFDRKEKTIKEIEKFLDSNGGFHDAKVLEFSIDIKTHTLILLLSDPLSNFYGFDNYKYIEFAQFIFNFSELKIDMEYTHNEQLYLYEITTKDNIIEIKFSPNGKIRLILSKDYFTFKI